MWCILNEKCIIHDAITFHILRKSSYLSCLIAREAFQVIKICVLLKRPFWYAGCSVQLHLLINYESPCARLLRSELWKKFCITLALNRIKWNARRNYNFGALFAWYTTLLHTQTERGWCAALFISRCAAAARASARARVCIYSAARGSE